MTIFKAIYSAVLVAFDRSIFNGGDHKCLDKTDIIIGEVHFFMLTFSTPVALESASFLIAHADDLKEIREYFSTGLQSVYSSQQVS